ncbi:MAG: hypothetical protein IPN15_06640 [Saprospiraceae bacterium]|nr:hypothetical protein [Candidatus Vicinibacter affinis]
MTQKATIYNGKIYTTGTEINDPLIKISIFEIDTSTLKVIRKIRTFENYVNSWFTISIEYKLWGKPLNLYYP